MNTQVTQDKRSIIARIFLSPREKRLRAGWRILLHFSLLGLLALVFGLIFTSWFVSPGLNAQISFLVGQLIVLLSITSSVYLARRVLDRRSFLSLGLHWSREAVTDLVAGFFIPALMMGMIYLLEWAVGWLSFESFAWQTIGIGQVVEGTALMLVTFLIVGWQEELIGRGYWLQNITAGTNAFWGVLLSSGFFALAHLGNPNVSWVAILGLVLAGIFLAYAYLRTRQLWLPIGLHIGWNFFEGTVFGFQVSGLSEFPHLIRQVVRGPVLITGGQFGPEAGLIVVPALLLGALVVWLFTRGRVVEDSKHE